VKQTKESLADESSRVMGIVTDEQSANIEIPSVWRKTDNRVPRPARWHEMTTVHHGACY